MIKIKKLEKKIPVYDITVEKNTNFFANDILVHNCSEITLFSDSETIAQCILSSIPLQNFVNIGNKTFDFEKLVNVVGVIVKMLNVLIDINDYSSEEAKRGAMTQRALAIGVQGLADCFVMLGYAFTSDEAKRLNKEIFEAIYYGALKMSNQLSKDSGQTYDYFEGSPISEGILQYHMWGLSEKDLSGMWDWNSLISDIKKFGVMNSTVTGLMPTASSAILIGSNEAFEPFTYNLYVRNGIGGEFTIINKFLVKELYDRGYWIDDIKREILKNNGSIQSIIVLDEELKEKYKTVFEISQKELLNMSADRGPFIDQSQSLNIFMATPTLNKLTASHFHSWKLGLKTGMYYLRTEPIDNSAKKHLGNDMTQSYETKISNGNFDCFGCSS